MEICIVDDGSTDGTKESIINRYSNVNVLTGPGDLYWAGGMRFAWENWARHKDFDYVLAFNDDITLYTDAVKRIIKTAENTKKSVSAACAVTGAFKDPVNNELAYSGLVKASWWHPLRFKKVYPNNQVQECVTLNMNIALISREAIELVGFLSDSFVHGKADYDYGLRLRKKGGKVLLAPEYVGICSRNSSVGRSFEGEISGGERWRRLTGMKEQAPKERAVYFKRHAGLLWPFFWLLPYVRIGSEIFFTFLYRKVKSNGRKHN